MKKLLSVFFALLLSLLAIAQNSGFEMRYKQAKDLYDKGQFEKARAAISIEMSLSPKQKSERDELVARCDQAIKMANRLELAQHEFNIGYESSLDSVSIIAGRPKQLTVASNSPSWCKVAKVENGFIVVKTEFNPEKQPREATILVKMGRNKKETLHITQMARPETYKSVHIETIPGRAKITVDGGGPYTGSWDGILASGSHRIRIEKNGYAVKDTAIVVIDDLKSDESLRYQLKLQPQFAKITLNARAEEGFTFSLPTSVVTTNGVQVGMAAREVYSYDDDRDIQRYSLYQDGSIPVSPGWVDICVNSPGFEQYKTQIQVKAGDNITLSLIMKPITGYLSVIDNGNARYATVLLDGFAIGTVNELTRYRTMVGEHIIKLVRDGYLPSETSYSVTVRENEEALVNVSMLRYKTIVFTSNPADARVSVDGEYIGNTPSKPYILKESAAGHIFHVKVFKDNYQSVSRDIVPDFSTEGTLCEEFELQRTYPFSLSADGGDLLATVKNSRRGDSTFVDHIALPAKFDLPYRKKPYYVELHRIGQKSSAYRGHFAFNEKTSEKRHLQSWSKSNFQLLSGNYFLSGLPEISLGSGSELKSYRNMGNVSFAKFRFFPGFSTSLLRGNLFLGSDAGEPLHVVDKTGGQSIFADKVGHLQTSVA